MKKLILLIICFAVVVGFSSCFTDNPQDLERIKREVLDSLEAVIAEFEIEIEEETEIENIKDEIIPESPPEIQKLDRTSPSAFIDSAWEIYGVILQDREKFLYTGRGAEYMQEIEHALMLFSPTFMRRLTEHYHREYRATYMINIEGHNDDYYGIAVWQTNVVVTLHFDEDIESCGITAPVLAHEIGHTIHFLFEEYTGVEQSELDMMAFNGDFFYVGDDYDVVWREKLHETTFAYDYGMHCYYEDVATIFELLAEDPREMTARLSDPWNEPLLLKTQYIREMTYKYISDECWLIFMPLYEAEEILGLRIAA